ncbi:MAG: cyclophilin-like fold protein [Planctomycetota bacterium]|jgi:hypothetical protein
MNRVRISAGEVTVFATIVETRTAKAILAALPLESSAQLWGDEVYFDIPVAETEEDPQAEVPSGGVAYWPPGKALCLFFGQTPYSPVNIVGEIEGDPNVLAAVKSGDAVTVELEG